MQRNSTRQLELSPRKQMLNTLNSSNSKINSDIESETNRN